MNENVSRRKMLGTVGAGGAALWAAPAMLSTAGAAAASQPPEPPTPTGPNLVINSSFEEPDAGRLGFFQSIPGWTLSSGDSIEIQGGGIVGSPRTGNQLVELDAVGSSGITQDVATTAATSYELSVWFSPRPGTTLADNALEIRWEGDVIDIVTADGTGQADTVWTEHVYTVVAATSPSSITFTDVGTSNGLGTYIDDVSLFELA